MTFQDLYTGSELLSICKKITNNHDLTDDLYQEVLLCLLEYDKNKLAAIEAQGSNNIKFFAVRIVMTMWRSPRSTFNYKYRKHLHDELNENINVGTFDETKPTTYDEAGIQDYIQEQEKSYGSIGKYPYDARILQHYIAEGSIRKLHRETGIPTSAIHFSLKKSKRQIKDYMFCQWTRKAGMKVWFCPWMQLQHVGMYVFGGSLVDLAQIGAAATADVGQLKKK